MNIGTLSFELQNDRLIKSVEFRCETIADLVMKNELHLLVCAGYTLDEKSDIQKLQEKLGPVNKQTAIIFEVQNNQPKTDRLSSHSMYFINVGDKRVVELGPQFFAESSELNDRNKGQTKLADFDENINQRLFTVGDKKGIAICCGEINVLAGRDNIYCRSQRFESLLKEIDIVVNPTHDAMANYGTLIAKRKFLSTINDHHTCYINSSNWNSKKLRRVKEKEKYIAQRPDSKLGHSVFYNGKQIEMTRNLSTDGYEFRTTTIEF